MSLNLLHDKCMVEFAFQKSGKRLSNLLILLHQDIRNWGKFKQDWFSDPSTYPLILIMGATLSFAFGAGVRKLTVDPDVRISPKKRRCRTMRTW